MPLQEIQGAIERLAFEGRLTGAQELRSGHVNRTYRLDFEAPQGCYILQKLNAYAFQRPDQVMENAQKVNTRSRVKLRALGLSTHRRVLEFVPARAGGFLATDAQGEAWRAYRFIDDAVAFDRVQFPAQFREAGRAFGKFQSRLADFPAAQLHETIPYFHHTPRRFADFVAAAMRDEAGRASGVEREIDFFFDRRKQMDQIVRRIASGELPLRVTHNDTKINNVLLDAQTGDALCVIDLDTVMPGSALYDFGDAIRFGAATADEDQAEGMALDMALFEEFAAGFLEQAGALLTPEEVRLLPLGVVVITCEIAMRFLTDYLQGDRYFKIDRPGHNLDRARAQMALLEDAERKFDQMQAVVGRLAPA